MSRRYTDEEKAAAIQTLEANAGNIILTAIQTSIPVRTLRDWKREHNAVVAAATPSYNLDSPSDLLPPPEILRRRRREDGEYTKIRQMLMEHLFDLTETLMDNPETAHVRISAISRLLDRVIKLQILAKHEQEDLETEKYRLLMRQTDYRTQFAHEQSPDLEDEEFYD